MSEIKCFYLPYVDNLLSYYRKLVALPGFVLLQSSDKTRGRYDILSAFPYDFIEINSNNLSNLENEIEQKIGQAPNYLDLPFQGGALGYFSYDLANILAGLPLRKLPALQDLPLAYLGLYDWALIVDHQLKKITVFAANTRPETQFIIEEVLDLWKLASTPVHAFSTDSLISLISKEEYIQAFSKIKIYIQQGRCYQVNLTQPFKLPFEGSCWGLYEAVSRSNPVPFAGFMSMKSHNILSFSPERFLLYDQRKLLTSPIKGTIHRSKVREEDKLLAENLINCPKNRAENVMIVDLLRNDLGKISEVGTIQVPKLCEIESFAEIHHLVSHVTGLCRKEISPYQAFKACFPGGSITGTPKLEAMKVIAEEEKYSRGVYCGSLGYFSRHGRFDTNIAIRTITSSASDLYLAAGGAIVMDSKSENEYQECFIKIAAILKNLMISIT